MYSYNKTPINSINLSLILIAILIASFNYSYGCCGFLCCTDRNKQCANRLERLYKNYNNEIQQRTQHRGSNGNGKVEKNPLDSSRQSVKIILFYGRYKKEIDGIIERHLIAKKIDLREYDRIKRNLQLILEYILSRHSQNRRALTTYKGIVKALINSIIETKNRYNSKNKLITNHDDLIRTILQYTQSHMVEEDYAAFFATTQLDRTYRNRQGSGDRLRELQLAKRRSLMRKKTNSRSKNIITLVSHSNIQSI